MKKTKIVVVGLGGVGGYYGGLLAKKQEENPETEIYFVARGANLQEIRENGLKLITETGTFVVKPTLATDNASEIGIADYVIMTTKSYDLDATIEQIKPCIGQKTVILPLLNGANISERIRLLLPETEVWDGCVYIVARLNEPGVVESSGGLHDLFFGAEKGNTNRMNFIQQIFTEAGIQSSLKSDIRKIIWKKFIFISTTASLTSYFNVGFRDLLTDDDRRETTLGFLREVSKVAESEEIFFETDIVDATIRNIERLPFETTTSMHSDFQAGKNTELETLTGYVVKTGRKNGVPTPVCEKVYEYLSLKK